MDKPNITRRSVLQGALVIPFLPILPGCRASLPALSVNAVTPAAYSLLMRSADAHGASAFSELHDVNVAYAGKWHSLVGKLQPSLVDAGFRRSSEERILTRESVIGQAHTGPAGHKHVVRHAYAQKKGEVMVWFNGEEAADEERRDAAALVVDAYSLFLFGPMLLAEYLRGGRQIVMELSGVDHLIDGKHRYDCDVIRVRMEPGIGMSDADQLALYIDRETLLMRRVRFSLEGLASTRGALAEVDTFESITLHGVQWPTRFHEKLLRPAPLQVHDWRLTGLDVDRRFDSAAISGSDFVGSALAPAVSLQDRT